MTNPYLQHLIPDSTYGYLFPHRLSIAALGAPNEYQVKKHRPSLTEGQHWIKIVGADHVERLYYTADGLLLLCDLTNTPQAHQLKQALMQHLQPTGAMVQTSPTHLYQPPTHSPQAESTFAPEPPSEMTTRGSLTHPAHPAALVAQHLQPTIERSIERAIAARIPAPPMPDTAALLFQQQQLDLTKQQTWTDTLLKAQQQTANLRPHQTTTITTSITNPAKRMSAWLDQQDIWAFTLAGACVICVLGVGSYLLAASALKTQSPSYQPQTQSW